MQSEILRVDRQTYSLEFRAPVGLKKKKTVRKMETPILILTFLGTTATVTAIRLLLVHRVGKKDKCKEAIRRRIKTEADKTMDQLVRARVIREMVRTGQTLDQAQQTADRVLEHQEVLTAADHKATKTVRKAAAPKAAKVVEPTEVELKVDKVATEEVALVADQQPKRRKPRTVKEKPTS